MSPAREYEQCRALIAAEWYHGVRIRRCDRLVGAFAVYAFPRADKALDWGYHFRGCSLPGKNCIPMLREERF